MAFRRGRGVSVTGTAPRRSPVVAKARELVAVARRYGFGPEELAQFPKLNAAQRRISGSRDSVSFVNDLHGGWRWWWG